MQVKDFADIFCRQEASSLVSGTFTNSGYSDRKDFAPSGSSLFFSEKPQCQKMQLFPCRFILEVFSFLLNIDGRFING